MKNYLVFVMLFFLFFSGSNKDLRSGYKPIYASESEVQEVKYQSPQEMITQGKIYVKDSYIFIGDVGLGVHIIDNSDPLNPQKLGFLKIYGNHDIAIKGNSLYADNYEDLITIDISNVEAPVVSSRIEGVYEASRVNYPPNMPYGTYFECVDHSKGYVVAWEKVESAELNCFTTN